MIFGGCTSDEKKPYGIGSAVCKVLKIEKHRLLVEDSRGKTVWAVIPNGREVFMELGSHMVVAPQVHTIERIRTGTAGTGTVGFDDPPAFRYRMFGTTPLQPLAITAEETRNLPGFGGQF